MYVCGFKHKVLRMANTKHDQHRSNHSTLGTHQCHLQSFYHDCSHILLESTSSKVARCPNNYYFGLMDSWTVFSDGEISGMGLQEELFLKCLYAPNYIEHMDLCGYLSYLHINTLPIKY